MAGTCGNRTGVPENWPPENRLVTNAMPSEGAIDIAAGTHNGAISFQHYGMTRMGLYCSNFACN